MTFPPPRSKVPHTVTVILTLILNEVGLVENLQFSLVNSVSLWVIRNRLSGYSVMIHSYGHRKPSKTDVYCLIRWFSSNVRFL